jgi:SAM-dependent methyltransferase
MSDDRSPLLCPACAERIDDCITLKCEAPGGYFGNEVSFLRCHACGFSFAPKNTHEYDSGLDFGKSSRPRANNRRVGTETRPGREYFMAVMAKDILQLAGVVPRSILIYGPGLSLDHAQLARRFPDIRVCICDLKNFQDDANFVPLDSRETFDIVVACEVAEHFTDPQADFASLLSKVSATGIAVLSTNISDGGELPLQEYAFIPGHTAYYSGRALTLLARRVDPGFRVDFRAPRAALAQLGPRKRYVLVYRDALWPGIADYFSRNLMAPSEAPYFRLGLVRRWNWLKRKLGP